MNTALDKKTQTVIVQSVIFESVCLVRGRVLVNLIDMGYFHGAYFYICCPLFYFSSRFIPGWVHRFVKADLRRATFPPP